MREIKFRVLDKETGKVYPPEDLLTIEFSDGEPFQITVKEDNIKRHKVLFDFKLLQFINNTDKNGKEIYEKDIVKTFSEEGDDIGIVMFKSGKDYQHKLYSAFGLYHKGNWFPWTECVEVLGNIYENPELLEG